MTRTDSRTALRDEIISFLESTFPGSTIYDGYYFVQIETQHRRLVREDAYEQVAEKMCRGGCWMICVGTDPTAAVRPVRVEKQTVSYNPDWNVSVPMTQWLIELQPGTLRLRDITSRLGLTSALVLIDPRRRIVFHVSLGRLYAQSSGDLAEFEEFIEHTTEPR